MSNDPDSGTEKAEILIIRRGGGDDNAAHKGGAWKIAYADFVTAMMAFFLVMWLINSANEATRARVASYFNPIKMTDAQPAERGINDPSQNKKSSASNSSNPNEKADSKAAAAQTEAKSDSKATAEKREEAVLQNPYKSLEALSTQGAGNPTGRMVEVPTEKIGDPFDPKAWEALREGSLSSEGAGESAAASNSAGEETKDAQSQVNKQAALPEANAKDQAASQKVMTEQKKFGDKIQNVSGMGPNLVDSKDQLQTSPQSEATQSAKSEATTNEKKADDVAGNKFVELARNKIEEAAARAGVAGSLEISVKITSEGPLISLADKTGNAMFEVGSALPTPQLIALVGTIGSLLENEDGKVVIRGHTDARQYKNLKFDNWQLSTARAHMASYMLIRGGLLEDRILKIEGYGATSPIEGVDPLDPQNRRVEFLLKK